MTEEGSRELGRAGECLGAQDGQSQGVSKKEGLTFSSALDVAHENLSSPAGPGHCPSLRMNEFGLPHASHTLPPAAYYQKDSAIAGEL